MSNYPDGMSYDDFVRAGIEGNPDPAETSLETDNRVRAVVAALYLLHTTCTAMIAAGENFAIGDLFPEEWLPDPLPTEASALAQAQAWAQQQADDEAAYIEQEHDERA